MKKLNTNDIKNLLMEAPITDYIGEKGAEIFAKKVCGVRQLQDNEFLFHKNDIEKNLYILSKGRIAFVKENPSNPNNPSILHVLTQGDLVGELSFIDDTPHTVSAMALGEACVLYISADDVRPLITEHPQLMFDFMRAVVKRVHKTVASLNNQQATLANYIYSSGKRG